MPFATFSCLHAHLIIHLHTHLCNFFAMQSYVLHAYIVQKQLKHLMSSLLHTNFNTSQTNTIVQYFIHISERIYIAIAAKQ